MLTWPKHSANWNRLGPPLRPSTQVVEIMKSLASGDILLMGVTPELHAAFKNIIAVDRDSSMIEKVWLGDDDTRNVMQNDWMEMVWQSNNFDAVVGDCALPMLSTLERMTEFQSKCFDWLKPGGVFVQRVMERPTVAYTKNDLLDIMSKPANINFHAFKWLKCMSIAAQFGYAVPDPLRYEYFEYLCNDRDALCERTGWSREAVDTVDLQKEGKQTVAFCNREELIQTIPANAVDVTWTYAKDYDLAEHCPILSWRKPL